MACRNAKKLRALIEVCVNDQLFEKNLRTSVFKIFLEILNNFSRNKLAECFGDKTKKKAKKHKKLISKLLKKNSGVRRRKKIFIRSSRGFKRFCYEYLLKDFFEKCVE